MFVLFYACVGNSVCFVVVVLFVAVVVVLFVFINFAESLYTRKALKCTYACDSLIVLT